jgi:hypothetical protein
LAIRRLLRSAGTEISREKISQLNFHGVQSGHTPRLRARGGSWKERMAKSKSKVKDTGKVKVKAKAKVVWNVRPHHILFPKRDERFLWE